MAWSGLRMQGRHVYPASTCARVVASGGCAVPLPVVDDAVLALDPEDACQHTIESGLVERPLELSLRDLTTLPSRMMVVTLECAGNGRSRLEPRVPGRVL
jgi:hypothetical protein